MKLMTEISGNDDDVVLVYNGDIDVSGEDQAEHDAAAAHALMQAMEEIAGANDYVFVSNALAAIKRRADEILAGWTGAGE